MKCNNHAEKYGPECFHCFYKMKHAYKIKKAFRYDH